MELSKMTELKNVNDSELNRKIKSLAAEERKLTKEILLHIVEVDKRKLYLRMAHPSLFDYLVKEIGYSAGAAQRRIDAARLMQRVPCVSNQIEKGSIHLSQISKVQKICRHLKKESGMAVGVAMQKAVLLKLENKTGEQADLILAQEFQVEIRTAEKKVIQKDESVRIELTLTKEEAELLKKAQELLSNKTGGGFKDTLLEMAERIVKSYEPKIKVIKDKPTFTSTVEVKKTYMKSLKSVTPRLRKEIITRDQICQFIDLKTNKKCGSKHFLEVDHIQPRYLDGPNTPQNLRVLCKSHNTYRYRANL